MISGNTSKQLIYHDLEVPENTFALSGTTSTYTTPVYRLDQLTSSYPYSGIYFNIGRQINKRDISKTRGSQHNPDASTNYSLSDHNDSITAISLTRKPSEMIISGSKDGIIKVFQ